jgi:elongation factor Tu
MKSINLGNKLGSIKVPLFWKLSKAERRFREAVKYIQTPGENFNFDHAIHLLEEVVKLKPSEDKYRMELAAIKDVKSRLPEKFTMHIEDVFSIMGIGTIVVGKVQQGVICIGDRVWIVGPKGERNSAVAGIEMFHKGINFAKAGDSIGIVLKGLGKDDIERGETIEKCELSA